MSSNHKRLVFHPADAALLTRINGHTLDVRSLIAYHVCRPFVDSGVLETSDGGRLMELWERRPQLVAINGVPC